MASYQIPSVSFVMPFFRQTSGWRYAGMGVNVISQQAGPNGLYKVTGATGTFAYTVHLSSTSHMAAGIGGGVTNKRVDASMTTDSQFNFGAYDPSLSNGENFQSNAVTRAVINAGFCWVLTDTDQHEKASLGIAAYNVNRPSFALLHDAAPEPVTYIVTGEFEVVRRERVSVSPTFRYINNGASMANLGVRVSYVPGLSADVLSVGVWYKTTGAAVAAIQYERKAYVLAASMDVSTAADQVANINNAFELSLGWRLKRKEKIKPQAATASEPEVITAPSPEPPAVAEPVPPPVAVEEVNEVPPVQEVAGTVLTPEEEQLSNVQIQFQLGSEAVSAVNDAFLDKLVAALNNHPDYQLKITGHTCTVGDKAINERISYERAEAVAQKLIAKGVPAERLVVIGMDIQKPIASNGTEAGRQQNRRVEFEWIRR